LPAPRVGNKRAAIVRAAVVLFGEGQFHDRTIPELARAAGVAEGTIYNYFTSKHDLAIQSLTEASAAIESDLTASVPRQAEPLEQLFYAATVLLQLAVDDPALARFALCVDHDAYLGERARNAFNLPTLLEFIMANAAERGQVKALPGEVLVALWLGVVRAAIAAIVNGRLSPALPGLFEAVAQSAADAVRA
jgi:AcrR family transcriptional regulator